MGKRKKLSTSALDLKNYIQSRDLPAESVADDLEITRGYIYMLTAGTVTPGLKLAYKIEKWSRGRIKMQGWIE